MTSYISLTQKIAELFQQARIDLGLVRKYSYKYEMAIILTCIVSIIPPPAFLAAILYVPIDPVRTLLRLGVEIEIKPSVPILLLCVVYSWSILAISNTVITFIIPTTFTIASCDTWTAATKPVKCISRTRFDTSDLGSLHCDQIIKVYRYNHVLCNYINVLVGNFRIALHFGFAHFIVVLISFILIKNGELFLEQGAYDLIGILIFLLFINVILIKLECSFIGTIIETYKAMKANFLRLSSRRTYSYKAAKSFQTLVVKTTYPLFTVSKDTYLEFWNVSVDHIVNLLCLDYNMLVV